jgi:hypothetical protein
VLSKQKIRKGLSAVVVDRTKQAETDIIDR